MDLLSQRNGEELRSMRQGCDLDLDTSTGTTGKLDEANKLLSLYFIQHCFICHPSDYTVSEDAGIEPRTVATSTLAVRRSNHSARSHPRLHEVQEQNLPKKVYLGTYLIKDEL